MTKITESAIELYANKSPCVSAEPLVQSLQVKKEKNL